MSQVLPAQDGNRFGTFAGVFTPCVLTILGVIMFLRFDVVVGNAGVLAALGIVFASNAITILTTLSLSAIATNTKVEGGGGLFSDQPQSWAEVWWSDWSVVFCCSGSVGCVIRDWFHHCIETVFATFGVAVIDIDDYQRGGIWMRCDWCGLDAQNTVLHIGNGCYFVIVIFLGGMAGV